MKFSIRSQILTAQPLGFLVIWMRLHYYRVIYLRVII